MQFPVDFRYLVIDRYIEIVLLYLKAHQLIPRRLQLRRHDVAALCDIHREGHQRGRHIDVIESPRHAVLAADGRQPESDLRVISAQQRRERLAPAGGLQGHPTEILLESEADLRGVTAGSHDLRHGLHHRVHSAVIRTPGGQIRVEAIAHHGNSVRPALQHRELGHHGLGLRQLMLSAVRHQHAARADGSVEHLHQPFLRTYVQIVQERQPGRLHIALLQRLPHCGHCPFIEIILFLVRNVHLYPRLLMGTVGIQKCPLQVHDLAAPPLQHQPGLLCHHSHGHGLQVLLRGILQERVHILWIHHHGHALLGLGDGQLRAVQACVLLGHLVQVHRQAVRQLTDGHRHASCAEIIAFLDDAADFLPAEQPLDFALRGRVPLLDLRAAGLDGGFRVHLGGTGGTAAAVAPGAPAQQYDHIPRIRSLADDILPGGSAHDSADFHPLSHIVGVIDFLDKAGGQPNLVAVGGISPGCAAHQLFLGKLTLEGIRHGHGRVGRPGHPHGLVHIAPAGQGVSDRAAQACGCAAERLYLRGMVMGLVLEEHQPLLGGRGSAHIAVVYLHRHHHGAGVDLIGLFHVLQLSFLFQLPHGHQRQIHQADELIPGTLSVDLLPGVQIAAVSGLDGGTIVPFPELHLRQLRGKGGMAAVVGPIGVQHPDLRHSGIALLVLPEILLNM